MKTSLGNNRSIHSWKIVMFFSFGIFIIVGITGFWTGLFCFLVYNFFTPGTFTPAWGILIYLLSCIFLGVFLSRSIGKFYVDMVKHFEHIAEEITQGNFSVNTYFDTPILEFQEICKHFDIMAKQLGKTEIFRKDFVVNVSHEFKSPLAVIEGFSALLQDESLPPAERKEYAGEILHNTKRLSELTGNILILSRLENQGSKIEKRFFDLDEQLRECIILFEKQWQENQLTLNIDLSPCTFYGNEELLHCVWKNLLQNAVKFTPREGGITVNLEQTSSEISVMIADTGVGMNEETKARIFEKFYQGDTSRAAQGNGLGMALVKNIVELHSGSIHIDSTEGIGTTMIVTLSKSAF